MRAHFFQNFYLQGIHAGIQSQHTTAEMFVKYQHNCPEVEMLFDWAANHKTTIVLNGGMQSDLEEIENLLPNCRWPWASFREDRNALNGALTNVGIILPEYVYNAPRITTESDTDFWNHCDFVDLNMNERKFIEILQSKRLMN